MHAASDHRWLRRRRDSCVLPRCRRCRVGEPVSGPQLDVGVADPQPNVRVADPQPNVRVADPQPNIALADPQPNIVLANPQPDAVTDFAGRLWIAQPDSNPDSRSDPHTEPQATTDGQPTFKPFAQFPAGTRVGSKTRPGIARRALPGLGTRKEAAPGHRRPLGAGDYPGPHPGSCRTRR
jgi:hypothetical protein